VQTVLTRHTEQLAEHELTLRRDSGERTMPGDPLLLERLVANLVDNAIKYNRRGGTLEVVVGDQPALRCATPANAYRSNRSARCSSRSAAWPPTARTTATAPATA
jgi:light-regulated signal transduction histidine kinase (bacteriophytochrome)